METENTTTSLSHLEGKYLTFTISEEQYGLSILKVMEIFGMMDVTRVPRTPEYVKGVINLRGKIIPVVDLRLKFGLAEKEYDRKTCIVVVNLSVGQDELAMGVIVDTVVEVRDFDLSSLAPAPDYGMGLDTRFIDGMGKHEDGAVTIILDLDKVFNDTEKEDLVPLRDVEG